MAMTKRVRVSFDAKFVASTEDVDGFAKHCVECSKRFLAGDKTLSGEDLEIARAAAEGGIESAVELSIKIAYYKAIKRELTETGVTVSNIAIRVVK